MLDVFNDIFKKIKKAKEISIILIIVLTIVGLCTASIVMISRARANNPLNHINRWHEQLREDSWMKDVAVERFIKNDLIIYQTGAYFTVTGNDVVQYTNDLIISEFSSRAKTAGPIIEKILKEQIKFKKAASPCYSLIDNFPSLIESTISLNIGEEKSIHYFYDNMPLVFELKKTAGPLPEIDKNEIYRFVVNYIENDKVAYLQNNTIVGVKQGKTRLVLYHNGEVRYYEIVVN